MAFGDALRPADGATVRLVAETGEFNAKIEAAERQWRESTGAMSREALKLDLAQDRLKKSLANYGAESAQAKRATIALKDAEEQAARAADKQTRETQQLDRATRSAGTGFSSMRKHVIGLAAAYVGVHGLVSVIRSSIEAAKEEQLIRGQTSIVLAAAGISYDKFRARIEQVIRAQSQLGFDDEALLKTFQLFVGRTKDVEEALTLNALAADVARARYIDLETASKLVLKASLGQAGALRRVGIDAKEGASAVELITLLTERYGRAAEGASGTAVAASDRLAVEWENMKEIVGAGLLPAVTDLSDRLADYFGDAENQRRVQERVNEAIETGEKVVRGFGGALRIMRGFLEPIVDLLGGTENAAKALFLVMATSKVFAIAKSFGVLRLAIAVLGPTATTSAATVVAAETAMGTGALAQIPKIAALRVALASLGMGGAAAGAAVIAGGIVGGLGITKGLSELDEALLSPSDREQAARIVKAALRQGPAWLREAWSNISSPTLRAAVIAALQRTGRVDLLAAVGIRRGQPINPPSESIGNARQGGTARGGRDGGGRTGAPTEIDLLLNLARPGNERADLEALRSFYARQIRALEARKNLTNEQKEKLRGLYGDIAGIQSQIDAIENEARSKEEARRQKQKERRERAARMREAGERDLERLNASTEKKRRESAKRFQKYLADAGKQARERGGGGGGLTEADFRRMSFEFLSGLQGVTNQFGSNIQSDMGQVATQSISQTWILHQQNRLLERMTRSIQHPGAKYARTELTTVFGGFGGI